VTPADSPTPRESHVGARESHIQNAEFYVQAAEFVIRDGWESRPRTQRDAARVINFAR
jgi:hypothetical protein